MNHKVECKLLALAGKDFFLAFEERKMTPQSGSVSFQLAQPLVVVGEGCHSFFFLFFSSFCPFFLIKDFFFFFFLGLNVGSAV